MSLDKSRIPKRGNSSRKFIPEKQRKTMTDPFVDWIKRSRSDKGETVSGRMVETRSQKTSEERKELLEVEVNTDHALNDDQEVQGLEGRGRRLASESTPVEQGHDFATSTGTLDREEMSELSDISTEVAGSGDEKISDRQHYDGRRNWETNNVIIVLRKNEEHLRKHLSIHHLRRRRERS